MRVFSSGLATNPGAANTLLYVKDKGMVTEPTCNMVVDIGGRVKTGRKEVITGMPRDDTGTQINPHLAI